MGIYGNILKPNIEILIDNFNNDITLFDTLYLQESIKSTISTLFVKIISLFKKAKQIFSNFILNINRFKSISLPKQEIEDLEKCLQVMQPRTLTGTKDIIKYYKKLNISSDKELNSEIKDGKLHRNSGPAFNSMNTTIEFEIDKSTIDIKESIDALEKLEEFKRINSNEYKDENKIEIPVNNLVSDMKECRSNCFEFEEYLTSLSNNINIKDEDINKKVIEFCKLNIKYYQQRILLLNKFFNNAKFSFNWVKGFTSKVIMSKLSTKKDATKITINMGRDKMIKLVTLLNELQQLSKNNKFRDYKKKHEECCALLGIPRNSSFNCSIDENRKIDSDLNYNNQISTLVIYFKKDENKIPVSEKHLYHHSTESSNITELKPVCIGNWGSTYYPEPRIYVHMNIVLNKSAKKLDIKNDYYSDEEDFNEKLNRFEHKRERKDMYDNKYVYEIIDKIDYVFRDPEMGNTGVYIESDKPIHVKQIDYEQWKKEKGMK